MNENKNYPDDIKYVVRRLTPTECARLQGFPDEWGHINEYTEDEFTDEQFQFWLKVRKTYDELNGRKTRTYTKEQLRTWHNKLHTDAAEYKMWGNGICLQCAEYIMEGIQETRDMNCYD